MFFGYEVLFYFLATHGLGWWMPSDTLVQPDVLGLPPAVAFFRHRHLDAGGLQVVVVLAVVARRAALLGQRIGRRARRIAGDDATCRPSSSGFRATRAMVDQLVDARS